MRAGNAQALAHGVPPGRLELHDQRSETTPLEHRRATELAEQRLGRPLSAAERRIDLVGLDRDLANAKDQLERMVDKAKKDAIVRHLRDGGPVRIRVTPQMRELLRKLYRAGQRHAVREIRSAGLEPESRGRRLAGRSYDEVERKLALLLAELSSKVRRKVHVAPLTEEVGVDIADLAATSVGRAVLDLPGARDVASRIVSTGLFSGLGDVYDANEGLFQGWQYTAVMDAATCDDCGEKDGTEYGSWDEAQQDLPDGGPNPDCFGEGRCRCRLVPLA